jgi:hypothetical protein
VTPDRDSATLASVATRAASGLAAALPGALFFRGFTVDDALISARVASHLASGAGYRFNPSGPEVDAVTPLGYAHLLALGGEASPLGMLERSRALGLTAYLLSAAVLGVLLPKEPLARVSALLVLASSAPLGAWASSGMETGLVTLLAVLGLFPSALGTLSAGVAAGLRPELFPFALVLAAGRAILSASSPADRVRRLALSLGIVVAPAVAVALVRAGWFGSPAPLATLAKPSDLAHGIRYALGGAVLTGSPLLLLSKGAIRRTDGWTRVLVLAVVAHFAAVTLVGGDWMALYRLLVPVLPAALLSGARLVGQTTIAPHVIRTAAAVLVSVVLAVYVGWPARHIREHRLALIESARAPLARSRNVATLDVGWVGAATSANVVDLAGVTDPLVARLPGGHTSKRIPEGLFESREVDAVVLLLSPGSPRIEELDQARFARAVEGHVAGFPYLRALAPVAELRLGGTEQRYLVLARR